MALGEASIARSKVGFLVVATIADQLADVCTRRAVFLIGVKERKTTFGDVLEAAVAFEAVLHLEWVCHPLTIHQSNCAMRTAV